MSRSKKSQSRPPPASPALPRTGPGTWTFLSNHTHVLVCLAQNPQMLMREVAARVGITERAVQRIVQELEEAGVLERLKQGRRNSYVIHADVPLRHPVEAHRSVAHLLAAVLTPTELARLMRS
ncbi:MAG: winged helix-turn-helix domain-containing protein [Phycisphaerae bacterium]|nr:winged helix-turn-helix domain-containing protein [Phycisphaerae bacterium]MDW8262383.1 winged helix-turn-helix transcriptional regulator [Phycisphaerales bacterium]